MAEENKNIDKFFADRLAKDHLGAEEWNIPSDDIWMAAKAKFEKKKKPKRKFIFWLFGSVLVTGAIILFTLNNHHSNTQNTITTNEQIGSKKETPNTLNQNNQPQITSQKAQNKTIASSVDIQGSQKVESTLDDQYLNKKKSSSPKSSQVTSVTNEKRIGQNSIPPHISQPTIEVHSSLPSQENSIKTNQKPQTAINDNKWSARSDLNDEQKISPSSSAMLLSIEKLILPITKIESEYKSNKITNTLKILPPIIVAKPRYEVGVSHGEFAFSALLGLLEVVINDDETRLLNFDYSINNLNLSGRKWIGKNLSYTYGTNLSMLAIRSDFEIKDTLDDELNKFIRKSYTTATTRNISNHNAKIELIDGVQLVNGDILDLKGNIALRLIAVQLPLMANYHIYKRKMEYLLGGGVTLDLMHLIQEDVNLSIFKEGQLINKPFMQDQGSEFIIDYSIYTNVGMRYHFSKKWNAGLSLNISILEPIFSYGELGIYYRWHK